MRFRMSMAVRSALCIFPSSLLKVGRPPCCEEILSTFYGQYGNVVEVLVAHSKAWGLDVPR